MTCVDSHIGHLVGDCLEEELAGKAEQLLQRSSPPTSLRAVAVLWHEEHSGGISDMSSFMNLASFAACVDGRDACGAGTANRLDELGELDEFDELVELVELDFTRTARDLRALALRFAFTFG